jgi:hypothetical protein
MRQTCDEHLKDYKIDISNRMESPQETPIIPTLPKVCKEIKYYYKHRDEILEKRRQKRLEDPEYQAKQQAKEEAKKQKEEEKKLKHKIHLEERAKERARKRAELLGIPLDKSSGATENTPK